MMSERVRLERSILPLVVSERMKEVGEGVRSRLR